MKRYCTYLWVLQGINDVINLVVIFWDAFVKTASAGIGVSLTFILLVCILQTDKSRPCVFHNALVQMSKFTARIIPQMDIGGVGGGASQSSGYTGVITEHKVWLIT